MTKYFTFENVTGILPVKKFNKSKTETNLRGHFVKGESLDTNAEGKKFSETEKGYIIYLPSV